MPAHVQQQLGILLALLRFFERHGIGDTGRDLSRNDLGTLDRIGGELATRIEEPDGPQLAVSVAQRYDYHRCDFQVPGFQFAGERQAADIGEYLGPASTHRLDDCRVFARRKCDAMQALEPRAGSATYLVVPCPVKCGDADAVTIEDRDHGGGSGLEDSLGLALLGQRAGQGLPLSLEFGGELQLRVRLLEGAGGFDRDIGPAGELEDLLQLARRVGAWPGPAVWG